MAADKPFGGGRYSAAGYQAEYQCASCGGWWIKRDIQVDHILPAGNMDDMNAFISRLFCEADNLQVLCKGCHGAKTRASG